jgi:CheY-like chemotaxis protein
MKQISILWADDEIDLLKPHVIFLSEKGYKITTCSNGTDAISLLKQTDFDLILLDEHMPGLSGLETLNIMKSLKPEIPVIMITKSEEENLMNEAIGSKIADYLIKPVNPKQILISVKKLTEQKKLVSEKTTSIYQTEFRQIGMLIREASSFQHWTDLYNKLVFWETELAQTNDPGLIEILNAQRKEANLNFARFIRKNYPGWISGKIEKPQLSHTLIKDKVLPHMNDRNPVFLIVIDNLRLDHWKTIAPLLTEFYKIEADELYCSILPTVTQYARNAIFSGLMPLAIRKIYPNLWDSDDESDLNNQYEADLLRGQLLRSRPDIKIAYEKINNLKTGRKLVDNIDNYMNNQLIVIVYNFMDILSHARTDLETIRELANDEAAYRTLMLSWFQHSYLFDLFKVLSQSKCKIIITTDHGSIKVNNPIKVIGDKETTVNLRYKQGRNLNYNPKEVFEVTDPESIQLPKFNISTSYIFAYGDDFMAYPNNFNQHVNFYKNTFQHGGISMEEMLIPFAVLTPLGF